MISRSRTRRAAFSVLLIPTLIHADKPGADNRRAAVESGLLPAVVAETFSGYDISDRMQSLEVPGITIGVIDDMEIDWAHAYGIADAASGRSITNDTKFNMGSVSKSVAALTALRLVDQGRLTLDDPINTYLKSWKIPDNEFTAETPVTLRHLLSHTGGTTVHGFPGYRPGATLPTIIEVLDGSGPANTDPVRVNRPPGQGYRYSGGGTTIVQLAIMDVTGKSFADAARELVFDPLGMKNSTYMQPTDGVDIGERATGVGRRLDFEGVEVFRAQAAAGLWSTPTDMARFLVAVMNAWRGGDDAIIPQSLAKEMLTPVSGEAALGFFVSEHDSVLVFNHGGDNTGFHAQIYGVPEQGRGAVVIVNSDNGREMLYEVLRATIAAYDWPADLLAPERVDVREPSSDELNAIAGRYAFGSTDVVTIARRGNTATYREGYFGDRVIDMLPLADGGYQLSSGNNSIGGTATFDFTNDRMIVAGTIYELPRMRADTIRPIEQIEKGNIDAGLAGFDNIPDVSAELMRLGAFEFPLDGPDRDKAVHILEYTNTRFPLDGRTAELLADAYRESGDAAKADAVRDRQQKLSDTLESVKETFSSNSVDEGLRAFDAFAGETGSPEVYRNLIGSARAAADTGNTADAMAIISRVETHLPGSASVIEAKARIQWAAGSQDDAIITMKTAIAANPWIERDTIERMWVRDRWTSIVEGRETPPEDIALYAGDYGPRHLIGKDGVLQYYRGDNAPQPLIPVGPREFMMESLDYFRIEIMVGENGRPLKIVGHYSGGRLDESPRDDPQTASP